MSADVASVVIAKYALTPAAELDRTLPLEPGDELLVGVAASTHYSGAQLGVRRSFVRVSTGLVCIVRRYGFIRDRILVIPPGAILGVEAGHHEPPRINFQVAGGNQTITVLRWAAPKAPVDPSLRDSSAVAEALKEIALALYPSDGEA
jgi:hypothetical protein